MREWLFGRTAEQVAAEVKAKQEEALKAREEAVAKAKEAGKKFHDDAFPGEHVHKTSKQLAKEELAKRQAEAKALTVATQTKPAKSEAFAGFGDVSAEEKAKFHAVSGPFAKRKAAIDASHARQATPAYKQAQLLAQKEAEKARLIQEEANRKQRLADVAEIERARAELLKNPKKAVKLEIASDIANPVAKPELDLGSVDRKSVAAVRAKMERAPSYAASKETNPLYRDLGFSRKSVAHVQHDMQKPKKYNGEFGLFKFRKPVEERAALEAERKLELREHAELRKQAELHVDPVAPRLGR